MASAPAKEVLVRVNMQRLIENAGNDCETLSSVDARTRLAEWGFRPFGQFWLGEESLLRHLKPDEIERVDPARPYGMFAREIPPSRQ